MASEDTQKRTNGILPMPASQASTGAPASTKSKTKTPIEGDKVVIRRLPPGLTEEEFWGFIGEKWKVGQGLVDWFDYQQGKVVQDPAKVSKPGRAYLHVLKREYLTDLSAAVEGCTWEDAKGTFRSPSLVGPPVVEFCIYKRIPGTKRRTDPRQGTIDQDPEFMAYLLSLTNPELDRDTAEDKTTEDEEAHAKVTTTPLVEYLKEKKANKAKDAAAAKSAKHARQESQGGKNRTATATTDDSKRSKKDKDAKSSKSAEKPKENIKILTKKAATAEAVKAAETAATQVAAVQEAPKSRRANIAAAARILQRDLGLSPGSAHRKARLNAAKSEAESKSTTKASASEEISEPPAPAPAASTATASAAATKMSAAQPAAPAAEVSTPAPNKSGRSRRGGGGKNAAEAKSKTETKESAAPTPAPAKPIVLLKKKDKESPSSTPAATQTTAPKEKEPPASTKNTSTGSASKSSGGRAANSKKGSAAAVTPGATRGFVKHANSSQGVTEPLLRQTLQTFGTVTSVEMDRRKGFAYVDFADHESLAKAIAAGPVSVGQGNVQVMERKDKKPAAAGAGNSSKDSKDAKEPAASSAAAPPAEKAEQPAKEQGSGPRRNRRGRGGGGGKGGGGGGDGKGAAAASKANAGSAGTA